MATSLSEALALYADGQWAIDELVPFLESYDFTPVVPDGGWPQKDTVQEIVSFYQAGQIPEDDYSLVLDALAPA